MKKLKMRILLRLFIWWINNDGMYLRGTKELNLVLDALLKEKESTLKREDKVQFLFNLLFEVCHKYNEREIWERAEKFINKDVN